jgi:site-specific recombinase XerC
VRRYFGWLARTGRLPADPSVGLSVSGGSGRLPRVLRDDEITAVLDDPPATTSHDSPAIRSRDDAVLELLYGSGLRVSEVCGLRPVDLDLDRRRVTVWGKGSKQRTVPLSPPACDALAQWFGHAATASDHVTCTGSSTAARRLRRTPMPCAIRSRRTCSTGAPTSAPCRRCSDMQICRRLSTTLT